MIVRDQTAATLVVTSLLTLACIFPASVAGAAESVPETGTAASAETAPAVQTITLVSDGAESTFPTLSRTVGGALAERGLAVRPGDFVSPDVDASLTDGTRIVFRTAVPVRVATGNRLHEVRSAATTVAELLRDEHVRIGRLDAVEPALGSELAAGETVRVHRVASWTSHERARIDLPAVHRTDATLPLGQLRAAPSRPGLRETYVRYTRRDGGPVQRAVLASRIIRQPRAAVITRGLARYDSLARVATLGFQSAVHMAGSALHMIATAYTASCYGCSGLTASGVRAGFGIIAVDPSVVPLGTKVFIPGYGRAIAGDTGGAILGNRIDLGFDSQSAALSFGRRPVTLYVLR